MALLHFLNTQQRNSLGIRRSLGGQRVVESELAKIIHGLLVEETVCRELTRSVSEGEP